MRGRRRVLLQEEACNLLPACICMMMASDGLCCGDRLDIPPPPWTLDLVALPSFLLMAGGRCRPSAFLACTPERLYARTGRAVASEAVAGTRPRGRGGDIEGDFLLSLDLLRSAKVRAAGLEAG